MICTTEENAKQDKLFLELAVSFIRQDYRLYRGTGRAADRVDILKILRKRWPHEDMINLINIASSIAASGDWVPKNSCSEWAESHAAC